MPTKKSVKKTNQTTSSNARQDENRKLTANQVAGGKSPAADPRTKAKTIAPKGQSGRGDPDRK